MGVVAGRGEGGNVICDLDGVVYLGAQPVPGAGEALRELEDLGFHLIFCTNNSYRPAEEVAARVSQISGYPAHPRQVVGSADAAAALLAEEAPPTLVLGGPGIQRALEAVGVRRVETGREAEAVVVGLDHDLSYGRLKEAVLAVQAGARLVATNDDPTYPTAEGEWPGAGAIVAAVERATGVTAEVAGKPHPAMRRLLRSRLAPGPVWVVGDRVETDLAMGFAEGWRTVLVHTGVSHTAEGLDPPPDLVLPSLAELPHALSRGR